MIIKLIIPGFLWLSFILSGCDLTDSNANSALNLKLDKQTYSVADTLRGTFTVQNLLPYPINFRFSSSCQFGLIIKSGSTIYREFPEMCAHVLTSLSLISGESKQFEFVLPLEDKEYKNLLKGNYEIEAFLLDNNSSSVSKPFTIN